MLISAILGGLRGRYTHIDPQKVITGLTPENARKKPQNTPHSCWELLHHTIVWHDTFLEHIKGESPNWGEVEETINWPKQEDMENNSEFETLLTRFRTRFDETKELLNMVDFAQIPIGKPELSTIQLFAALLQHMSYHLGQMVTIRQSIGDWPPKQSER